jgi:hypothetical protein
VSLHLSPNFSVAILRGASNLCVCSALQQKAYRLLIDQVDIREILHRVSASRVKHPDVQNHRISELRGDMFSPSPRQSISHVFPGVPQVQMIGADAFPIVTMVKHHLSIGNRSPILPIRKSMRASLYKLVVGEDAVTLWMNPSCPFPAPSFWINYIAHFKDFIFGSDPLRHGYSPHSDRITPSMKHTHDWYLNPLAS